MLEIIDDDKEYLLRQNDFYQRRILVLDENRDLVQDLSSIWKDNPMYQVVGCSNTKDAVEVVKIQEIHIILLDAVMMEMDGYEMLENILGKNNIPVVLMCEKSVKISCKRHRE